MLKTDTQIRILSAPENYDLLNLPVNTANRTKTYTMAADNSALPTTDLKDPDLPPGLYHFVPEKPIPAPEVRSTKQRSRDRRKQLTRTIYRSPHLAQRSTLKLHSWISDSTQRSVLATGIAFMLIISMVFVMISPKNYDLKADTHTHTDIKTSTIIIDPDRCDISEITKTAVCALK